MSALVSWMDRKLYPTFERNWDDELFRRKVLSAIRPDSVCLDYGAGRGRLSQMNFRGIAQKVAGIDPDPLVLQNPHLDDARVLDLSSGLIPYPDRSFDLVFADNVMEHVADPMQALSEIARVLKPGGRFLAKTPNKWHYIATIARFTPTWFHRTYNSLRGREGTDTFPTLYRCNSEATVRRLSEETGFSVRTIDLVEGRPEYLRLLGATYLMGWAWERTVNAFDSLRRFRCVLIFELERR
jgi:SAM-dependent methyltransferase